MEYLWTKGMEPPQFPALHGNISTDVLVIGGGMAGILCALLLQNRGLSCVVAEGKRIGTGITKGTTAVISAQHGTLYSDLIKKFGVERAKSYLHANLRAVRRFDEMAANIECEHQELPSLMYAVNDAKKMEQEAAAVRSLGFPALFLTKTSLPFPIAGAVQFPGMAQFHPLKFLYGAAKNLHIYENTFVQRVEGNTALSEHGTISAKKIVIATHFPIINSHGMYSAKLYQKRSFVLALENAPKLSYTVSSFSPSGIYLRNYQDLLLFGGGDRRTGTGDSFEMLRELARRYYPQARETYAWATQDCMSLDGVPYIGRYSRSLPNVYVATGFNEWGMSSSMLAAELLADMLSGCSSADAKTFAPSRSMLRGQLFLNMGETLLNFVNPVPRRCTHLGCALKWNKAEHTWDCPCHGSRFDANGSVIDNPAMRHIRIK